MVCFPWWENNPKPLWEKPLTDVNLAIVFRTFLAATFMIPTRAAKELLTVVLSHYLPFFLKFPFIFSVKVGNILSVSFKKMHWTESKRNWEKPLINTAWPPTSQTCAYQHDLETNPDTTLTCLRVEYRKRNWEKPLISTQKCVYRTRVPCKRSKERPRPFSESESGKNSWLTLNSSE